MLLHNKVEQNAIRRIYLDTTGIVEENDILDALVSVEYIEFALYEPPIYPLNETTQEKLKNKFPSYILSTDQYVRIREQNYVINETSQSLAQIQANNFLKEINRLKEDHDIGITRVDHEYLVYITKTQVKRYYLGELLVLLGEDTVNLTEQKDRMIQLLLDEEFVPQLSFYPRIANFSNICKLSEDKYFVDPPANHSQLIHLPQNIVQALLDGLQVQYHGNSKPMEYLQSGYHTMGYVCDFNTVPCYLPRGHDLVVVAKKMRFDRFVLTYCDTSSDKFIAIGNRRPSGFVPIDRDKLSLKLIDQIIYAVERKEFVDILLLMENLFGIYNFAIKFQVLVKNLIENLGEEDIDMVDLGYIYKIITEASPQDLALHIEDRDKVNIKTVMDLLGREYVQMLGNNTTNYSLPQRVWIDISKRRSDLILLFTLLKDQALAGEDINTIITTDTSTSKMLRKYISPFNLFRELEISTMYYSDYPNISVLNELPHFILDHSYQFEYYLKNTFNIANFSSPLLLISDYNHFKVSWKENIKEKFTLADLDQLYAAEKERIEKLEQIEIIPDVDIEDPDGDESDVVEDGTDVQTEGPSIESKSTAIDSDETETSIQEVRNTGKDILSKDIEPANLVKSATPGHKQQVVEKTDNTTPVDTKEKISTSTQDESITDDKNNGASPGESDPDDDMDTLDTLIDETNIDNIVDSYYDYYLLDSVIDSHHKKKGTSYDNNKLLYIINHGTKRLTILMELYFTIDKSTALDNFDSELLEELRDNGLVMIDQTVAKVQLLKKGIRKIERLHQAINTSGKKCRLYIDLCLERISEILTKLRERGTKSHAYGLLAWGHLLAMKYYSRHRKVPPLLGQLFNIYYQSFFSNKYLVISDPEGFSSIFESSFVIQLNQFYEEINQETDISGQTIDPTKKPVPQTRDDIIVEKVVLQMEPIIYHDTTPKSVPSKIKYDEDKVHDLEEFDLPKSKTTWKPKKKSKKKEDKPVFHFIPIEDAKSALIKREEMDKIINKLDKSKAKNWEYVKSYMDYSCKLTGRNTPVVINDNDSDSVDISDTVLSLQFEFLEISTRAKNVILDQLDIETIEQFICFDDPFTKIKGIGKGYAEELDQFRKLIRNIDNLSKSDLLLLVDDYGLVQMIEQGIRFDPENLPKFIFYKIDQSWVDQLAELSKSSSTPFDLIEQIGFKLLDYLNYTQPYLFELGERLEKSIIKIEQRIKVETICNKLLQYQKHNHKLLLIEDEMTLLDFRSVLKVQDLFESGEVDLNEFRNRILHDLECIILNFTT